jgi:hypothetical protein
MDAAVTPQMLIIGSLIALLLVGLVARHFDQRRHTTTGAHRRFGDDHSDAITEMGNRTRAEAQRKERERLNDTTPNMGR